MIVTDLVDLGLAIAFATVALAIAAALRLRTKAAARRNGSWEKDSRDTTPGSLPPGTSRSSP